MKNLTKVVLLSATLLAFAAMSGCVYVLPARPGYAAAWVPGHYNGGGYWVPGHWH
jgi:hypothetical protein